MSVLRLAFIVGSGDLLLLSQNRLCDSLSHRQSSGLLEKGPGDKILSNGPPLDPNGLLFLHFGVLEVNKFENHYARKQQ